MVRYLRLFALFARLSIQNEAAYRADFFTRILVALVHLGGEVCMIWMIFSNTRSLAGWTVYEAVVLVGVFRVMSGLIGLIIAPNMRSTMERIRTGTLDFLLTKPVDAQFFTSFSELVVWRGIDMALGMCMVAVGCTQLASALTIGALAQFVLALGCGAVVIYSFWLVLATLTFWLTKIANVEMIFWNIFEAGRYPIDIYRPWVRWGLTFIIPLAFITSFPAAALVGKEAFVGVLSGVVVAPLTLLAATMFWRFGLRRYSGASA